MRTSARSQIVRLRRRAEFLAAARGSRLSRGAFRPSGADAARAGARVDHWHRHHRDAQDRRCRGAQSRQAPPARGTAPDAAGSRTARHGLCGGGAAIGADLPVRCSFAGRAGGRVRPGGAPRRPMSLLARPLVGLVTAYRWLVSPVLGEQLPLLPVLLGIRYRGAAPTRCRPRLVAGTEPHDPLPPLGWARLRPGTATRRPVSAAAFRSFPPS